VKQLAKFGHLRFKLAVRGRLGSTAVHLRRKIGGDVDANEQSNREARRCCLLSFTCLPTVRNRLALFARQCLQTEVALVTFDQDCEVLAKTDQPSVTKCVCGFGNGRRE
jgi:hypothetical protein